MMTRTFTVGIGITFFLIWCALLQLTLNIPAEVLFSHDARSYSLGAIHLVQDGFYSLDGITPFVEREPGYSLFLAFVYFLFGIENRIAIFALQGLLYFSAVFLFVRELRLITSERIAQYSFVILLVLPSVFHAIFSVNREIYSLSLLLFIAALFLSFLQRQSWRVATAIGFLLGVLIITYIPFLFFPFFLALLFWIVRLPKKYLLACVCIPFLLVGGWGARNYLHDGNFRLTDSYRTTIMWYVRGEQAKHLRGSEPFLCLWAEYIARDWTNRSHACSTTGLFHQKWPDGVRGDELEIAQESRKTIVQFFPHYLWFSLFEILEFHLPYVNGWGRLYNVLAAMSTAILYFGCLISLRSIWRREYSFFLILILYSTAVFSLTDATPRYHIPTIFCYAVLAAVGYDRLVTYFMRR